MSPAPDRPECEWCDRPATVEITAHWSIFDWIDYLTCDQHRPEVWKLIDNQLVDGEKAKATNVRYFEDGV